MADEQSWCACCPDAMQHPTNQSKLTRLRLNTQKTRALRIKNNVLKPNHLNMCVCWPYLTGCRLWHSRRNERKTRILKRSCCVCTCISRCTLCWHAFVWKKIILKHKFQPDSCECLCFFYFISFLSLCPSECDDQRHRDEYHIFLLVN